jgi:hypothetical protein
MALPTTAEIDAAVAASGSPRPDTALMNALLKNLLAYHGTQVATRNKTGNFDFGLADAAPACFVDSNSTSSITGTVRPNGIVAFPVGTVINLCRKNTGAFLIAEGTSVTIHKPADRSLSLRAQYSTGFLRKIATNEWLLGGDLT